MNDSVLALAVSDSDLYAGGYFTAAGGSVANYIAKWNGSAWSSPGLGMSSAVRGLAVSGTDLYAGGSFTTAGILANYIARWNGTSWTALGSGMNNNVYALAVSGSDIYAGGSFTTAGGRVSAFVAKWAPLAFQPNSVTISNGTFQALLTGPDTNSVVVDSAATLADWTPVATNTLPPGGAWPLSLPIGTNSHQSYRARLGP
jgi:hypothetical protein